MAKGSYKVGEDGSPSPRKDTSYRSFICILLIFLCICLIILLASMNWGGEKNKEGTVHGGETLAHRKDKDVEMVEPKDNKDKTHEKLNLDEETTTRKTKPDILKEDEESTTKKDKVEEPVESKKETTTIPNVEHAKQTTKSVFILKIESALSSTESDEITSTLPSGNKEQESSDSTGFTDAAERTTEEIISSTDSGNKKQENSDSTTFTDAAESTTEEVIGSTDSGNKKQENSDSTTFTDATESTTEEVIGSTDSGNKKQENSDSTTFTDAAESTTEEVISSTDSGNKKQENSDSTTFTDATESTTEEVIGSTDSSKAVISVTKETETESTTSNVDNEISIRSTSETYVSTTDNDISTIEAEDNLSTTDISKDATPSKILNTESASISADEFTTEGFPETSVTSSAETEDVPSPLTMTTTRKATTATTVPTTSSTTEISIMESEPLTLTTESSESNKEVASTSTSTTEITIMESEPDTQLSVKPSSSSLAAPDNVCKSVICKTVSSRILSMINHSTGPCDDFYEFACGRSYQIEEESEGYVKVLEEQLDFVKDTSEKFLTDFKKFYEGCLVHEDYFNYRERMNGLEKLVLEVGQFQTNNSTPIDFTDLVSSLLLRQSMPLFDIGLDVDRQTSNLILQLNLPHQSFLRTGIEDWSGLLLLKNRCLQKQKSQIRDSYVNLTMVYESFQECQHDYSSYLDSVEAVIRELDFFAKLEEGALFKEVKNIRFSIEFDVLNNLESLPSSADILKRFINKNYEIRRVADLQFHFPLFDWKRLLQTLTGHEIRDSTTVQVYFTTEYFLKIFANLAQVDKWKLNNALLAIYAYDLFVNTVIPNPKENRNNFCIDLSKKLLPDAWAHLVHKSFLTNEQERENKKLESLFEELKKKFCRSLLTAQWIDENTKPAIMTKCNGLNLVLFKPPESNSLINNYKTVQVTGDYQKDLINLLANFKRIVYSKEGSLIDATTIFSYFLDPLSVKPLTFYASPMIAVPLGLQKKTPHGLPDYLVKTRVGFALARQLARHFDPTGMNYGIRLDTASDQTYPDFIDIMTNLMDYSSPRLLHHKNVSFKLEGSLSINERIVDNAAFRLIYDSIDFSSEEHVLPYMGSQYSSDKVFFIATAQEFCKKTSMLDFMLQVFEQRHLPAVLRVENIIGSSQQCFSTFSCPEGSAMDFPMKLQFPFIKMDDENSEEENLEQN